MTYLWAYLAGTLTLINPCVLPLLPIVVASAFQSSRWGPIALALGLTTSFAVVGVGVTAFGHVVGIDDRVINRAAAVLMIIFGAVLLIPRAQVALTRWVTPLASGANSHLDHIHTNGLTGQLVVGLLLGAVWSPCIGPTLGGAIGLAASGEGLVDATLTMFVFGIGVSTVLMALAYGSREVIIARRAALATWMPWAKPLMGATLLVVGVGIWFHIDRLIETWALNRMPAWLLDLSTLL